MRRSALVLAVAALLLAGCATTAGAPSARVDAAGSDDGSTGPTLTVFAAASLRQTFSTLGRTFESQHPGTTVAFSFAGSADLVTQLEQGAPADVFAAADTTTMARAVGDNLVARTPVTFATNTLQIAVPPSNPARISSFTDLTRPGVKVVVCAVQVPCGAAARRIETATSTTIRPVSEENAVTDVLGKVQSGEADAGLVYVTDVKSAGDRVRGIPFEESGEAVNTCPIAALSGSLHPDLAEQFVVLVAGSEGRQVLAAAGFGRP